MLYEEKGRFVSARQGDSDENGSLGSRTAAKLCRAGYDCIAVKRGIFNLKQARKQRIALACLLFLFAILPVAPCHADDAAAMAARQLVQKIESQLDHNQKIGIEVADLTNEMHAADLEATRQMMESDLRAHGFHVVTDSSFDVKIRFTLSRDSSERLWVADFMRDGRQSAVMVPFELIAPDLSPWVTGIHLDRELVFSQNSPMLDFACDNSMDAKDCGKILILTADKVVYMAPELNFPSAKISEERKWSRDLRGRLVRNGPSFEVSVGDAACQGDVNHMDALKCRLAAAQQWIFSGPQSEQTSALLANDQDFFDWMGAAGPSTPQPKRAAFYSVAGLQVSSQPAWIATGLDGKARVFTEKGGDPLGSISGWGSEIATVKSTCGTGWQILATAARDYSESDAITIYEWIGNEFRADSGPMEMNGPIVAMWSASDGGSARAVVRNLKTGNYEAYLLKVGCSQ